MTVGVLCLLYGEDAKVHDFGGVTSGIQQICNTTSHYCLNGIDQKCPKRQTGRVFQWLSKTIQETFSAPRNPCQPQARFSKKVAIPVGSFTLDGDIVSFHPNSHLESVPEEPPRACVIHVGPGGAEYRIGPVGSVLSSASRNACLDRALSFSQIPAPSRLRNFFGYRKRLKAWQYVSACPVFYELIDGQKQIYNRLMKCGADLSRSPGRYFDITEDHLETLDLRKRNAGASRLLDRSHLQVSNSAPLRDRFNFAPLAFHEHLLSLYFLPDAIVISVGLQNTYFRYQDVHLNIFGNRFITSEVPQGVQPIDYTWQFVNKNGGPDRRFNDNFQIPIIEVTELDFHFSDGSQIHTAFTDARAVKNFGEVLCELGARA